MTYCTTTELIATSGSGEDETTVLTPIIEAADREIDAYLARFGLSGSATGAIKQASLKLSLGGLLERGLHLGQYSASGGTYSSSLDVVRAVEANRKAAFVLLDQYIETQTVTPSTNRIFVKKVN